MAAQVGGRSLWAELGSLEWKENMAVGGSCAASLNEVRSTIGGVFFYSQFTKTGQIIVISEIRTSALIDIFIELCLSWIRLKKKKTTDKHN